MKNKLPTTEVVLPSSTLPSPLSQIGDKNTAVHHANNVIINNYIQTESLPPSCISVVSADEAPESPHDYYNLFVISDEIINWRFTIPKDRSLQSGSDIVKKLANLTPESIAQIKTFPSLFMNENTQYGGRTSPIQEAYYGFVTDLRVQENGFIKIRFRCEAKINQQQINDIVHMLDIHAGSGIMELNHTHWTIKNVNLIEELTEAKLLLK